MVGNLLINISFKYVLTWWCWLIWAKFLYRDSWTNILFFSMDLGQCEGICSLIRSEIQQLILLWNVALESLFYTIQTYNGQKDNAVTTHGNSNSLEMDSGSSVFTNS